MKTLDAYIRHSVLFGMLVVLLVLLPLVAFLILPDELDNVGTGRYSLGDAFTLIALSLPAYGYQIFPIAAMIGSLQGLGGLAVHSELIAMRAAGISVSRIVWSVLKAGLLAAAFAVLVGEVIAPMAEEKGAQLRAEVLSEGIAFKGRYGFWARDGESYINIREIMPGGRLRDIYIYEFDDNKRLKVSTHARAAFYTGNAWRLSDLKQSRLSDAGVEMESSRQAVWGSLLDPGMLSLLVVDPHTLPVWGLYRYIGFMQDNGLSAISYQVAFWGKLAMPLVILAMMFLSVPLLFGTLRSGGIGQRIFVGVLIGIGFYVLSKALSQLSVVYTVSPLLTSLAPAFICIVVASLILRRI